MPPTQERFEKLIETLQSLTLQLEQVRCALEAVVELTKDHETRLRRVEVTQHRLMPLVGGIVFLATTLLTAMISQWWTRS